MPWRYGWAWCPCFALARCCGAATLCAVYLGPVHSKLLSRNDAITAIFLKETLDAAGEDHEVVMSEKEATKKKYMQ